MATKLIRDLVVANVLAIILLSLSLICLVDDVGGGRRARDRASEEYGALGRAQLSNDAKAAGNHANNLYTLFIAADRALGLRSLTTGVLLGILMLLNALNLLWLWKLTRSIASASRQS